jgi:hypothetical protein
MATILGLGKPNVYEEPSFYSRLEKYSGNGLEQCDLMSL